MIVGRSFGGKVSMRISCDTRLLAFVSAVFFAVGCSEDSTNLPGYKDLNGDPVPAFSLIDVNPNSATHDQAVSPRDFSGKVSAWYFGSAT